MEQISAHDWKRHAARIASAVRFRAKHTGRWRSGKRQVCRLVIEQLLR